MVCICALVGYNGQTKLILNLCFDYFNIFAIQNMLKFFMKDDIMYIELTGTIVLQRSIMLFQRLSVVPQIQ